ncbi:MAG: formylglycine-generating enzyme family protein [Planctomycetes bacterium]|nr:formylglycine-generating enzyme family protein [Planctomycetota bacterium]
MPTPHRSLSCLLLPLLTVAAVAQSWSQVTPSPANPAPSARNRAAMVYDTARGQALLFGGYDGTTTPRSDFWSFNGTGWQQLGGTVPAGRWGHGMVYDTRRERVVLFGGFQPSLGNPLPDAVALQDTWEYAGFGWTQRTPTAQPSARGYFGFAYDPIRARSVLFGGAGPNTSYLQDTWEWNGTAWTLVNTPARPSIRRGPAMAFDLERAEVVLFGGGAFGTQFGDTWIYNGTTWTQRALATSPPARWEATVAFDPLCGRTLLMGGTTFNYQTIFSDSWNWDGATWTQVAGTQPSARHGVAAAFDLQAGRSLWAGGRDAAGFRSDLWGWTGGCPRTMSTVTPAVMGQTAQYRYSFPATAVNNPYFELWTLRNPNAFPLQVPGIVSVGLTRVDLFFVLAQNFGVLGASGVQNTVPFAIPNTNAVVGFTYDVQDVDIDVACDHMYWASNDVEATVWSGSLNPALNMIAIAPGTFQMGSVAAGAAPVRAVTISRPFWMGQDEVTQAQYQAVMGSNPSNFQGSSWPNAGQRPVERVTWSNAVAYCDALSVQEAAAGRLPTGYEYRLPTEAEWEYCCRAGTTTEWSFGSSVSCSQANFAGAGTFGTGPCVPPGQTTVVGSYAPNAWGLRDMHGNVWEWCLDAWVSSHSSGAVTDPYVLSTSGPNRVIRGGSWGSGQGLLRSAHRQDSQVPTATNFNLGFRVVCAPVLP